MQEFTRFAFNMAYYFTPIHNDFQVFTCSTRIIVSQLYICFPISLAAIKNYRKEYIKQYIAYSYL